MPRSVRVTMYNRHFMVLGRDYCAWWRNDRPDRLCVRAPRADQGDWADLCLAGYCIAADGTILDPAPDSWRTFAQVSPESNVVGHRTLPELALTFAAGAGPGEYRYLVRFLPDRIVWSMEFRGQAPLELREAVLLCWANGQASRFDASEVFNPTYHGGAPFHRFSPSVPQWSGLGNFSPGPVWLGFGNGRGLWHAASIEDELPLMQFARFGTRVPGEGQLAFRLDYPSRPRFESYRSPALVLRFGGSSEYEALRRHAQGMVDSGLAAPPQRHPAPWWRGVMVCGWRQQIWCSHQAGQTDKAFWRREHCSQQVYDNLVRALDDRGLDFDMLIIDDFWGSRHGLWEADTSRWPDLRGFADRLHARGRRLLLWVCINTDGLDDDEVYVGEGWRQIDPFNPKWLARLNAACRRMFGDGPGCYRADGIKLDFTGAMPGARPQQAVRELHGLHYIHERFEAISRACKAVREDCLLDYQVAHPQFAALHDMTRLNDYFALPEYGLEESRTRSAVAACVNFGALIDTDHTSFNIHSYARGEEQLRRSHELGNPSFYVSQGDLEDPLIVGAMRANIAAFRRAT